MLHACVERFDVIGERGNILGWDEEVNKAKVSPTGNQNVRKEFVFSNVKEISFFQHTWALFTSHPNPKYFLFHLSH
jgi:hypothetical protein